MRWLLIAARDIYDHFHVPEVINVDRRIENVNLSGVSALVYAFKTAARTPLTSFMDSRF